MKYVVLACLCAASFDATVMGGHYRHRAGAGLSQMSASVSQSLRGRLS